MSSQRASADAIVARIAARQHGVVSVRQLRQAGLNKGAVAYRTRTGRLHRIHRGVYRVGHTAPSRRADWMAAVLACGGGPGGTGTVLASWGAALSHRSAAALWGLLPSRVGAVDIAVAGDGGRRRRSGIRLHRVATLVSAEVVLREGIPLTTAARTVADLRGLVGRSGGLSDGELRRAIRQAGVQGLPLPMEAESDRTRSELERDFLALCDRHRLPAPEVNVRVGSVLVDFIWRNRKLIVETDGYRYHRGRQAFEDDRERDLVLRSHGFEVVRLTHRQITMHPRRAAGILDGILSP
jgi:very-short-patch-repair endonuclease